MLSGHTDMEGSASYNFSLSNRRMAAVQNYLLNQGIAATRIKMIAYGETMPTEANDTQRGKAQNRRVELILLGGE